MDFLRRMEDRPVEPVIIVYFCHPANAGFVATGATRPPALRHEDY
jgi:hypothetical protein